MLLVEDNLGDVRLIQEALKEAGFAEAFSVAHGDDEALRQLKRRGSAGAPLYNLVFLDLNLPGMSGRELLSEIKSDRTLMHIPVVIITTSEADHDILQCYRHQASAYVSKAVGLERFLQEMQTCFAFWFKVAKLPMACDKQAEA
ncbi:MAG: hypothetical protein DCC75_04130 [Proteobacteria bacterium]|nr:MAG: hypothetical protein DCC75_04130 [Pseudomonadota bacterium]